MPFDPDRPIYWCWGEPLGDCATDDNYVHLIRPNVGGRSGTWAADWVCDAIENRHDAEGDQTGRVGICIQNFGYGDYGNVYGENVPDSFAEFFGNPSALLRTDEDGNVAGIPASGDPGLNRGFVPFFSHGIIDASSWVQQFITQYQQRQDAAPEKIPDPTAFWMDTENHIFVNEKWTRQWALIKEDDRWDGLAVTSCGRSWADIVRDFAVPDPATPGGKAGGGSGNLPHANAVVPWLWRAMRHALEQGFFTHVESKWPGVMTCNWLTTWDGPRLDYSDNPYVIDDKCGTHQCPVIYANADSIYDGGLAAAFEREVPFPQPTPRPFAPWIQFVFEGDPIITPTQLPDLLAFTVTKYLERGHRHLLLWGNPAGSMGSVSNWNTWHATALAAEAAADPPVPNPPADVSRILGALTGD